MIRSGRCFKPDNLKTSGDKEKDKEKEKEKGKDWCFSQGNPEVGIECSRTA